MTGAPLERRHPKDDDARPQSARKDAVPPFIVKTNLNNLLVTYLLYRMTLVVSHLSERLSFQHLKVLCIL